MEAVDELTFKQCASMFLITKGMYKVGLSSLNISADLCVQLDENGTALPGV